MRTEITDLLSGLSRSGTDEWTGPCPFCGGEDRFIVTENAGRDGRQLFWCRDAPGKGCGRAGDAITLLQELEGYSFKEAKEYTGLDPADHDDLSEAVQTRRERQEARMRQQLKQDIQFFRQWAEAPKETKERLRSAGRVPKTQFYLDACRAAYYRLEAQLLH